MKYISKSHKLGALLLAWATVGIAACQSQAPRDSPPGASDPAALPVAAGEEEQNQSVDHKHHLVVHWVTVDTFGDLVASSDLIARGRVVRQRTELQPGLPEIDKIPKVTISTIAVDEVLSAREKASSMEGKLVAPAGTIEVEELGGPLKDGCVLEPEDNPLLQRGDEALLFLANHRTGAYHTIGGYQGRFDIHEGLVSPLTSRYHPDATFNRFDRRPQNEVIQAIRAMLAETSR